MMVFSLWDSKVNEFNSVDMGPGIDVVGAIAEETRKRKYEIYGNIPSWI